MKATTVTFIIAEILDVITTVVGLACGFRELNPIAREWLIPIKILSIGLVVCGLQLLRPYKILWIIPAFAWVIVIWNLLNIWLYCMDNPIKAI